MPSEFRVAASLWPARVEIAWTDRVPLGSARPSCRLVRRRDGFPAAADDGLTVVDVDDLFQLPVAPDAPWGRIERLRCVATNSNAEGGLLQGAVELYFATGGAADPVRAAVSVYDPATGTVQRTAFADVSRVAQSAAAPTPPYTQVQAWEIFETPGGGPEVSRGSVTFFEFVPDPLTPPPGPSRFRWAPAAGPVQDADYDERRLDVTVGSAAGFATTVAGATAPSRWLEIRSAPDPDAGLTEWSFTLDDGDLDPGVVYYYRVFGAGGAEVPEPARGSALATRSYGAHEVMYRLLPPVHQVADADPTAPNGGRQLYRFLAAFGLAVDHVRGLIEGVADRHDVVSARADFLPHLARMIGWLPDLTVSQNTQRQDIGFAAEIFGAVGTVRNPPALVNRVTGWPCRVKEFVHNVFLTNAPETVPIWEIWQVTRGGGAWSAPAPLSLTTSMDGGPVALEAGGAPWVIWHSDRSGRRELWFRRLGVDPAPRRVMEGAPDDAPSLTYSDETPAAVIDGADVRLFWVSDRDGARQIWTRVLSPAPGLAERLTDHPKEDGHPAAVRNGTDLWLFWDSNQRGPRDLWYRRWTGGAWGAPARVAKDPEYDALHDTQPAAVISPLGDLWLFWCRDRADRREIWHQVVSGGAWGPQQSLSADLPSSGRDEAPWPVVVGGQVWLFFHSNRGGPWQVWARIHDGTAWQSAALLSDERTADQEPTGFVDGSGDLHVFWTSQRRTRWYQSRTLDLSNAPMLAEMGTLEDHGHYTYDTGATNDDWYARGTVGIYLEPDVVNADAIAAAAQRAAAFLEPFRAAPVRYVWPLGDIAHEEAIEVGGVGESWSDGP